MATKREWLAEKGLAKAGARGKFSKVAHEALVKAVADGVVFDEPTTTVTVVGEDGSPKVSE